MDLDASFGHWLTRRRKALRLSRAELARRVCCAAITLRKIEEDARRPSQQIAARLAEQLAIAPAECATFIRVARGELRVEWLPPAAGASRLATSVRPTNLPIPTTPLIGRAADVAAVRALLLRGDVRLLTLSGAPGIGKTRLSLQVAADLRDAPSTQSGPAFADGVYFIPLAPLGDPGLVLATIAQTLGVAERAGQPMRDRLAADLREKDLLLVLDNFEHVLGAAPQLAELLGAAPRLTLLVTSRVALRLSGEQRYAVPPLALPNLSDRLPNEVLTQYAAVDLFVQRARTVQSHFAMTESNAQAVAAICIRLDGVPLAIELAATRIALFTPPELLAHLDQRFALLTAGARDMPPRQQTLRRAIDWSYTLLDEPERTLFRRLGIFMGDWTREAAEAVCGNQDSRIEDERWKMEERPSILDPRSSILDGLAALLDKSLLRREEGSDGQSRFSMLETIREYARERLVEAGELERMQERHLAYYLALAEVAESRLSASNQRVWLGRLEQDHDNLRIALAWAVDQAPELALRLSGALTGFWLMRGHHSEGRAWLERALAPAGSPMRGKAEIGDTPDSPSAAGGAARAQALHGAGMLAHVQQDGVQAQALFAESLALARAQGDSHRIALLLNDLGELAFLDGDIERAASLYAEGLALARAADDRSAVAWLLLGRGDVEKAQGDLRSAAADYEEGLAIGRALDDQRQLAWALHRLGHLALEQGKRQRAAELFAEGLALAREVGDQESTAWLLYATGLLLIEQHDLMDSAARFAESARLLHVLGAGQGVALNLAGLAAVMIEHQHPAQAARLLSVADAQHWVASAAAERAEYDRTIAVVHAQLDEATFAAAWAEGQAITLEQALAYALNATSPALTP